MTTLIFYPESFYQLCRKLEAEHGDLWKQVGYYMANNHVEFIKLMNAELNCVCLPEMDISVVCDKYLAALRTRKGRPASKSLELIHAEKTGKMGLAAIFGNEDDDGERGELQAWKNKNPGRSH